MRRKARGYFGGLRLHRGVPASPCPPRGPFTRTASAISGGPTSCDLNTADLKYGALLDDSVRASLKFSGDITWREIFTPEGEGCRTAWWVLSRPNPRPSGPRSGPPGALLRVLPHAHCHEMARAVGGWGTSRARLLLLPPGDMRARACRSL